MLIFLTIASARVRGKYPVFGGKMVTGRCVGPASVPWVAAGGVEAPLLSLRSWRGASFWKSENSIPVTPSM